MRNIIFLFLVLVWFIASCKPDPTPKPDDREPPKQYSYWVVNEDSFSTNDVALDIGKGTIRMGSNNDVKNYFRLQFNFGYQLPVSGDWPLSSVETQDPQMAEISFYYKSDFYIVSTFENAFIHASLEQNKARYALPPTWFVNYYNHNDSVLIHGVFNEP